MVIYRLYRVWVCNARYGMCSARYSAGSRRGWIELDVDAIQTAWACSGSWGSEDIASAIRSVPAHVHRGI